MVCEFLEEATYSLKEFLDMYKLGHFRNYQSTSNKMPTHCLIWILQEGEEQEPPMSEEELINLIDGVLRDDDKNNDGYIDYAEFAKSLQ